MLLPSTLQILFEFWQLSQNFIGSLFWDLVDFFFIIRVVILEQDIIYMIFPLHVSDGT